MDEEKKRLVDELKKLTESKKENVMKILQDINIATNPAEGYIRGEAGSQNIKLIVPKEERDASATIEKEIPLNKKMRALVAHELREGGKEATGLQLETPNFNIRGSTDHNKEQRANFSGQTDTPLGTIGGRYNTDFARNENGEIFWRSPDGKWNASGSTNFDDFTQANIGYNTDKFNIDLDMDSMGNENLRAQWNPNENLSLRGGTDFGGKRNISAALNYPIYKNLVAEALYSHTGNRDEDDNYWGVGLKGKFN